MCHTNPTVYSFSILLPCTLTADSGQAWGLLELSPCLWRTYPATMLPGGAPQGTALNKPLRAQFPHAQKGRPQEPIPPTRPTPGPRRGNQDALGRNSSCTVWMSIYSPHLAEQSISLVQHPVRYLLTYINHRIK